MYFNITYKYLLDGHCGDNTDTVDVGILDIVEGINLHQFESDSMSTSTNTEVYNSPEYTPYHDHLESEESEEEGNQELMNESHTGNTNNAIESVETIIVDRAKKSQITKKLIKNKRVFCLFCEQLETNFPRHLERKHALEPEVKEFILLPKKSKERVMHLELLKNKGNLQHNRNVLEQNKGSLIVGRRPPISSEIDANNFLPCTHCFKFFKKQKLYRHINRCPFKSTAVADGLPKRRNNLMQSATLLHVAKDHTQLQNEVFVSMKCDDITFVAQSDDLICLFGSRLLKNHRERHLKNYISQRLRQLAKFLQILRGLEPDVKNLKDFLVPKHFKTVVQAAKELSGYDEEHNTYVHPTNALKIGHSILQCADILQSQFLVTGVPEEKLQNLKYFTKVFNKEWRYSISSNACADLSKKKFNKSVSLPDAKDITLLHNFLLNQLEEVKSLIENNEINHETYKILCQNLLTQIILLNRRRSGEVQRIKVIDYLNRSKNKLQEEIQKSLSEVEIKLSESFERFEIRGKRGRAVPVLLTGLMKESIDLLLKIRNAASVFKQNEYLFAIPNTAVGCYRGSDCLRKAANECGSSAPELLTSTKLRKHIATMSQLLNLSTNDREQLANFMGHDLAIHNEYYRLPNETLQISRVSKILLAMESGNLHELKGKTLEQFDDFLMPSNAIECSSDSDDNENVTDSVGENALDVEWSDDENIIDTSKQLTSKKQTSVTKTKTRVDYIKWSNGEMEALKRFFGKFIALHKIPQQHDCLLAIKKEPALGKRPWKKIKFQCEIY
ncbi:uncharacterized protein LOC111040345 [Myzus persicae]|uniref:uncharacterized protein LOC111040345 n=1 Tax=Myzus persicae TaxID=13164 RepID=UPI000B930A96|nr:uncharacterized protein LOC111040345 [Myzus persicae]